MKGKEAAAAANRRAAAAEEAAASLRTELESSRRVHQAEVQELKAEVERLRSQHRAEAGRLAAEEVARQLAEQERMRTAQGFSDSVVRQWAAEKEKFVRNACRYVSMRDGVIPPSAFEVVSTWMTEQPFRPVTDPVKFCIKHGLLVNGWVAGMLKRDKYWQKVGGVQLGVVTLDEAEAKRNPAIHPDYKPKWYRQRVDYGEIAFEDDDEEWA